MARPPVAFSEPHAPTSALALAYDPAGAAVFNAETSRADAYLFLPGIMKTGTVKFFNDAKGFGFITDDATKQDFFVHITGLNGGQVQQNDRVEFDTEEGRKGVNAVNVRRI